MPFRSTAVLSKFTGLKKFILEWLRRVDDEFLTWIWPAGDRNEGKSSTAGHFAVEIHSKHQTDEPRAEQNAIDRAEVDRQFGS